ncbi:bifunctional 2-polyprenyl-6-hydroxyphenol methylase/3-demethylubiquinol 3-O-methyltransferase UbiG [Paraglaciecola sp.]|uniref:class I SAM-dependent methyltransferase n=1 Tax=Paraglaciecola sp. TaxID=1920173 RepID=UPI00273F6BA0|nr:methyltransferase domain-containing protein [Paraglaciecola sp.]MDP5033046.1 methyltransferase domain-containing protein [Paraglaciecola sp.]
MSDSNITYYSKQAESLSAQYDNVSFTDVHSDWLSHLPNKGRVLDVGAGSGRDAAYLANKGLSVVAVEPAEGMRSLARITKPHPNIHWLDDTLPELKKVFALQIKFDLILLSAVWMHIAPSSREKTFRNLSALLKPNGKLVISLRHGECHDERVMYDVSVSEHAQLASKFGLSYELATAKAETDKLGRKEVSWQTVVLTLPDDGTGAFPLIRNIVVNDNKSSTYKLALLRSLLRIAEGHPGAVMSQSDDCVELPLGFIKETGWQQHSQTVLSERQVKVLNRLLDSFGEEFELGINARKYQGIADVSKATATRDLADLVAKQCLVQLAGGGRSTRYVINIV